MSLDVGDAFIQLLVDLSPLDRAFVEGQAKAKAFGDRVEQQADRMGKSFLSATNLVNGMFAGTSLTAGAKAFDVLSQSILGVVKSGTEFNTQLTTIQNNTTMTSADVGALHDGVLKLASETGAPIKNLAEGFQHVMNITGDTASSMEILNAATASAVATGGDASKTANVLANAMHEYGTDVSTAATAQEKHNDVLVAATKTMGIFHLAAAEGNMTLEQFSEHSGRAIGVAANLGVPLEQVSAAFVALTKHGFDAAGAGVQVTDMLTHMINPGKQAEAELVRLGKATGIDLVNDFTAAGIHAKGLDGVLKDLHDAFQKMGYGEAEATAEAYKLINAQRGGLGVATLLGTAARDYAGTLKDGTDQSKIATINNDSLARKLETVGGQFDVLKASVQASGIQFSENLQPALLAGIKGLEALGGGIHDVMVATSGLRGMLGQGIEAVVGFAASHNVIRDVVLIWGTYQVAVMAATVAQTAFLAVTTAIPAIAGAIAAATTAASVGFGLLAEGEGVASVATLLLEAAGLPLIATFGLVAVAVVGLGIGIKAAYDHVDWFREKVDGLLESLGRLGTWLHDNEPLFHVLGGTFKALGTAVHDVGEYFGGATETVKAHYSELATIPDEYHQVGVAAKKMAVDAAQGEKAAFEERIKAAEKFAEEQKTLDTRAADERFRAYEEASKKQERAETDALTEEKRQYDEAKDHEIKTREQQLQYDLTALGREQQAAEFNASEQKRLADQTTTEQIQAAEKAKTATLQADHDIHESAVRAFEGRAEAARKAFTQQEHEAQESLRLFEADQQHALQSEEAGITGQTRLIELGKETRLHALDEETRGREESTAREIRDTEAATAKHLHDMEVRAKAYEEDQARELRGIEERKTADLHALEEQTRSFDEAKAREIKAIEETKAEQLRAINEQTHEFEEGKAREIRAIDEAKTAQLHAIDEQIKAQDRQAQEQLRQIDAAAAARIDALKAQQDVLKRTDSQQREEEALAKRVGAPAGVLLQQYHGALNEGDVAHAEKLAADIAKIDAQAADLMRRDRLARQEEAIKDQIEGIRQQTAAQKQGIADQLKAFKDGEAQRKVQLELTTKAQTDALHQEVQQFKDTQTARRDEIERTAKRQTDALHEELTRFKDHQAALKYEVEQTAKHRTDDIRDALTRFKDEQATERFEVSQTSKYHVQDLQDRLTRFKDHQAALKFEIEQTAKHDLQVLQDQLKAFRQAQIDALNAKKEQVRGLIEQYTKDRDARLDQIIKERQAEADHYLLQQRQAEQTYLNRKDALEKEKIVRDNDYVVAQNQTKLYFEGRRDAIDKTGKAAIEQLNDEKKQQDFTFGKRLEAIHVHYAEVRTAQAETHRLAVEQIDDQAKQTKEGLTTMGQAWQSYAGTANDSMSSMITQANALEKAYSAAAYQASLLGSGPGPGPGPATRHAAAANIGAFPEADRKIWEGTYGKDNAQAEWKKQATDAALANAGVGAGMGPPFGAGGSQADGVNNARGDQIAAAARVTGGTGISKYWDGDQSFCETYVEDVAGVGWRGSSAIDAWGRWDERGAAHSGYPQRPGDLVYFEWGKNGHVGVYEGNGMMRSALHGGVQDMSISDYLQVNHASLLGYVEPFLLGGQTATDGLAYLHSDEMVISQATSRALSDIGMGYGDVERMLNSVTRAAAGQPALPSSGTGGRSEVDYERLGDAVADAMMRRPTNNVNISGVGMADVAREVRTVLAQRDLLYQ